MNTLDIDEQNNNEPKCKSAGKKQTEWQSKRDAKQRKRRQEIHSELKIYNYGAGGDKENGQGALSEENFLKLMKDSKINESHRCKKKNPSTSRDGQTHVHYSKAHHDKTADNQRQR